MFKKKYDLAIINRSFWPESEILGEAKLRLAEKVTKQRKACVIAQSSVNVAEEAEKQGRGNGVRFYITKSRASSSSGLVRRVFDALCFGPFVFWSLLRARPKHVYVSTNPPVLVPLIVFLYCSLYRANYTYHLQDIHPEITNLVVPMNKLVYKLLRWLDNITLRNAESIITLSEDMATYLRKASGTNAPIILIPNPSFEVSAEIDDIEKDKDIIFCGNAGRVQKIPILLESIKKYIDAGGTLKFSFVGGGVYASQIQALANEYIQVTYHGFVKPSLANQIVAEHRWAILPIEDEITKYAFPSKSSSYLASKCNILGLCGKETAVARWINEHNAGISVSGNVGEVVTSFFQIERGEYPDIDPSISDLQSLEQFSSDIFRVLKVN